MFTFMFFLQSDAPLVGNKAPDFEAEAVFDQEFINVIYHRTLESFSSVMTWHSSINSTPSIAFLYNS